MEGEVLMDTSDESIVLKKAAQYSAAGSSAWMWAALLALTCILPGCSGEPHLNHVAASYEGGYEIALLQLRVFGETCAEALSTEHEAWIAWSHVSMVEEFSDSFQIGTTSTSVGHVAARDDGKRMYYSLDDVALVVDRFGNGLVTLGAGMGAASFHTASDRMVVEGPGSLALVDLDAGGLEDLDVDGLSPSFSPDGAQLTYTREGEAWVFDLETTLEWSLGEAVWPRFTDQGTVVAFHDGGHGPGVYEAEPSAGIWQHLGDIDPDVVSSPWWRLAPDGERVIVEETGGRYRLQHWSGTQEDDWVMSNEMSCEE